MDTQQTADNNEPISDNGNAEVVETPTADNGGGENGADNGGGEAYVPDDSILERAVKAGMSLADAKSFGSKEMAERFIGMLEGKGGKGGGDVPANGNGDGFPAVDFGDFSEENGYDPNIVKAMGSLKSVIEAQAKVIKELRQGRTAANTQKAVETRRNLIISRPGGERGRGSSGKGDAESQAIASLRARFKLN